MLGDSLSAGYGLRQEQSWPRLLDARLAEAGLDYRVANASVSGETSAGGRSRLAAALKQHRPRVVIIALGANDGLRGLPVGALRENIEAMSATARQAGARALVVGMDMPPNYGAAYRQKFRRAFADAAAAQKAAFVPFMLEGFGDRREMFQADTIHPGAAAQPLIVDNIWPALRPLLDDADQATRSRGAPSSISPTTAARSKP